jgi:hypothetical protein
MPASAGPVTPTTGQARPARQQHFAAEYNLTNGPELLKRSLGWKRRFIRFGYFFLENCCWLY